MNIKLKKKEIDLITKVLFDKAMNIKYYDLSSSEAQKIIDLHDKINKQKQITLTD